MSLRLMLHRMMSLFSKVQAVPPIETFKVTEAYCNDHWPSKNEILAIKSEDGKPYVLPIVAKIENDINTSYEKNYEYNMYFGDEEFSRCAGQLLFGENLFNELMLNHQIVMAQTLGGTGALRMGGEFLTRHLNKRALLLPSPTWDNHHSVFEQAGFHDIREFSYYNFEKNQVDFGNMVAHLMNLPNNSVIVLHVCCHNPSGADLTKEQWIQLELLCKVKSFLPFFDCSYQGLATGDVDDDVWSIRYFVARGHDILCAHSFAKIFTLFNERVGNLSIISSDSKSILNIQRQLAIGLRANWNNPNCHGSHIIKAILSNGELTKVWKTELKNVFMRLEFLKKLLVETVHERGGEQIALKIDYLLKSNGMFAFLPISEATVRRLESKWHIYLHKDSRVNFFGINKSNVQLIADALISELSLNY